MPGKDFDGRGKGARDSAGADFHQPPFDGYNTVMPDVATVAAPSEPGVERPTIPLLLGFLFGHRASILTVARAPGMLLVGVIFVLSVGLAREYDGEYLWANPWYALAPLGVSVVMAAALWIILYATMTAESRRRAGFWRGYRALLAAYWMTAPLAWLYGIPVERWSDAYTVTERNLTLLLVVSVWRVVLMTRVISVLLGSSFMAAAWPVLLFSAGATFLANLLAPTPPIAVMGGIRLSETEELISRMTYSALLGSFMLFPVFLVGTIVVARTQSLGRNVADLSIAKAGGSHGRLDALIAIAGLFGWLAVAPGPQVEQRNRYIVEQAVQAGRFDAAERYMSVRSPSDFPPHWSPPPNSRGLYHESSLMPMLEAIVRDSDSAAWVREAYIGHVERFLNSWHIAHASPLLPRLRELLERMPEGARVLEQYREMFDSAPQKPAD